MENSTKKKSKKRRQREKRQKSKACGDGNGAQSKESTHENELNGDDKSYPDSQNGAFGGSTDLQEYLDKIEKENEQLKEENEKMEEDKSLLIGYVKKETISMKEMKENLNSIEKENKSLKEIIEKNEDQKLCKICLDKEKRILFQPCGHLISCEKCVPSLEKKCPMCRQFINKFVKAYMS